MALNRSSGALLAGGLETSGGVGVIRMVRAWRSLPERRRVSAAIVVGRHEEKGVHARVVLVMVLKLVINLKSSFISVT